MGQKRSLWRRIRDVALTDVGVLLRGLDEAALERVEELLLESDFGVAATTRLLDHVRQLSKRGKIRTARELHDVVTQEIAEILDAHAGDAALHFAPAGVTVFLLVGVNGVGKTTTIGKLAHRLQREGRRVLLGAADTFRAGAIEQLRSWAERTHSDFVGAQPGADPASVAYDAIDAAEGRNADVVLLDTAGRLHTHGDLMAELSKIERVVARRRDGAPHETLLVLDATIGQNALVQQRTFSQTMRLTGLVLAKLDSSARGGVVVALSEESGLPVKLIGTGEGIDDLGSFDTRRFARQIIGEPT